MMNHCRFIHIILFLLLHQACKSQNPESTVVISIPTIEQEASSIWRTINDIAFLEGQGYTIHLPEDDVIDSLILKSKDGIFGNDDFQLIYQVLESDIYKKESYQTAFERVDAQEKLLATLLQQLSAAKKTWQWDFQTFESYEIVFTLYGTGGSYDPETGRITLFTNPQGDFMKYDNPVNTIIHEIIHMGIEQSIVQRYQLNHGLKERLVDTIVYLLFGELLPEYKIQDMGDTQLDVYLQDQADLQQLPAILEKLMDQ